MKYCRKPLYWLSFLVFLLLSGCSAGQATPLAEKIKQVFPSIANYTPTPFQPQPPTPTRTPIPSPTPAPVRALAVWLDPAISPLLRSQIHLPEGVSIANTLEGSNIQVGALRGDPTVQTTWIYVVAAAFPTLQDTISLEEINRAWRGESGKEFTGPLLMSEDTRAAFTARWGAPGEGRVSVLPADQLLDAAWKDRDARALIPFEAIEPKWKVLPVDGVSLFARDFDINAYPLTVWFGVSGQPEALQLFQSQLGETSLFAVSQNLDPNKLTTLVMTGVTALARATGAKMEANGMTYPARDIVDWLRNADLTHISNEVSFTPSCPPANPNSTSVMFCSKPEYIELLDYIGTDIVELSGNHNNDWGRDPFTYSLNLYKERGWKIFAGGENVQTARTPLKIEHNGNKLAFIGCNPVGPAGVWATDTEPGVANCEDYGWLLDTIRSLRSEGYLPIVTFQYFEIYVNFPSDHQERNFRAAADAGAVIVSGSQAHFPQYMEFYNNTFIHYGLGNLFFDQMDIPVPGTRREFIDRHVFYDGKYIQTELLTAMLEDYARPRPMTQEERDAFLSEMFHATGW
jgi:hypothetical protein